MWSAPGPPVHGLNPYPAAGALHFGGDVPPPQPPTPFPPASPGGRHACQSAVPPTTLCTPDQAQRGIAKCAQHTLNCHVNSAHFWNSSHSMVPELSLSRTLSAALRDPASPRHRRSRKMLSSSDASLQKYHIPGEGEKLHRLEVVSLWAAKQTENTRLWCRRTPGEQAATSDAIAARLAWAASPAKANTSGRAPGHTQST